MAGNWEAQVYSVCRIAVLLMGVTLIPAIASAQAGYKLTELLIGPKFDITLYSAGKAINKGGQTAIEYGYTFAGYSAARCIKAQCVLIPPLRTTAFNATSPSGINDAGYVTGGSFTGLTTHAFLFDGTNTIDLGALIRNQGILIIKFVPERIGHTNAAYWSAVIFQSIISATFQQQAERDPEQRWDWPLFVDEVQMFVKAERAEDAERMWTRTRSMGVGLVGADLRQVVTIVGKYPILNAVQSFQLLVDAVMHGYQLSGQAIQPLVKKT